jgi:hypothetical protein
MYLYLRLLQETGVQTYSADEVEQLREFIRQAPGVTSVKEISRDPKGGYSVVLDASKEQFDALIKHISVLGYRPVI